MDDETKKGLSILLHVQFKDGSIPLAEYKPGMKFPSREAREFAGQTGAIVAGGRVFGHARMSPDGENLEILPPGLRMPQEPLLLEVQAEILSFHLDPAGWQRLRPGQALDTRAPISDLIPIYLEGHLYAWGEILAINDEMGIRIIDLVQPPEYRAPQSDLWRLELGRAYLSPEDATALTSGSMLTLDSPSGRPFNLFLASERLFRAEVLIFDETYGIRLYSPAYPRDLPPPSESEAASVPETTKDKPEIPDALEKLKALDPQLLTLLLIGEHPQLIALTLAELDAEKSAWILEQLPETLLQATGERMLESRGVTKEFANHLWSLLLEKHQSLAENTPQGVTSPEKLDAIRKQMNSESNRAYLEERPKTFSETPDWAKQEAEYFKLLDSLDDDAIQILLNHVSPSDIFTTLDNAPERIYKKIERLQSRDPISAINQNDTSALRQDEIDALLHMDDLDDGSYIAHATGLGSDLDIPTTPDDLGLSDLGGGDDLSLGSLGPDDDWIFQSRQRIEETIYELKRNGLIHSEAVTPDEEQETPQLPPQELDIPISIHVEAPAGALPIIDYEPGMKFPPRDAADFTDSDLAIVAGGRVLGHGRLNQTGEALEILAPGIQLPQEELQLDLRVEIMNFHLDPTRWNKLKPQEVIYVDAELGAPMKVFLEGILVAYGEGIVIEDTDDNSYTGVRITETVQSQEKLPTDPALWRLEWGNTFLTPHEAANLQEGTQLQLGTTTAFNLFLGQDRLFRAGIEGMDNPWGLRLYSPHRSRNIKPPKQYPTHIQKYRIHRTNNALNKVRQLSAHQLTALLANEHPQLIASTLAEMEDGITAGVLNYLPRVLRNEVTTRMLYSEGVNAELAEDTWSLLLQSLEKQTANHRPGTTDAETLLALTKHMHPTLGTELRKHLLETFPEEFS